jgi:predicted O-methyltransferase YrrM
VNDRVAARWRAILASLAVPLAAGLLVGAVVLIARFVSSDAALVAGPAVATTVVVVMVGRMVRQQMSQSRRRDRRLRRSLQASSARAERSGARQHRRLFDQLAARDETRDIMAGGVPLPVTRGFVATPDILRELASRVVEDRPEVVVETGTGASTIAIAASLKRNGSGHLWCLEHLTRYADATRRLLDTYDLGAWVTVVDAPLVETVLPGGTWPWYDISGLTLGGPIELLFVDGPPGTTAVMARYPAIPALRDRLSEHAVVILDDAARPDERRSIQRWQAEMPGLAAHYLPREQGACVLVMGGDVATAPVGDGAAGAA